MKKVLPVLFALLLLTSMAACGKQTSTEPPQTDLAATGVVTFADPALEEKVRGAMGKPDGDITVADAKTLTHLNLAYAEWQKYISENEPISSIAGLENFTNLESLDLTGNAITDITPLSALTNLKALILTGCEAEDYTPIAGLTSLQVLILNNSAIADPTPLFALSGLKCLYLEGSQIRNYMPLADIRATLEQSDFEVAYTLAELGFSFDDNDKLALYQTDEYDIRLNHAEWGGQREDWQNCIRVVTGTESGYKIDIGFYPVHNAYVVWIFDINTEQMYTYVYDVAAESFGCDRAEMEPIVQGAFVDVNDKDILLTPFVYYDNIIQEALGISIDILYDMPFDENIQLQSKYLTLGFEFLDYKGTYFYQENGMEIYIHKPQWDENVEAGHELDWSISFFDPNVKGYQTLELYFADKNAYYISMVKDGVEVRFDYYPDEDKFKYDPQNIDSLRSELNEALNTQGDDFMKVPMSIFKGSVEERFGVSIEELYALSEK